MVDQLEVMIRVEKIVKKCVLAWYIVTEAILRGYTPTTHMLHRMTKVCVQGTQVIRMVSTMPTGVDSQGNHPFSGLKSGSPRPRSLKLVGPTRNPNPLQYRKYQRIKGASLSTLSLS